MTNITAQFLNDKLLAKAQFGLGSMGPEGWAPDVPDVKIEVELPTKRSAGSKTKQPKGNGLTKSQFKERVLSFKGQPAWTGYNETDGVSAILRGKDFVASFGLPTKTQVLGDRNMLYWSCGDGMVQVVVRTDAEAADAGTNTSMPLEKRVLYLQGVNEY